jgi:hypothetical protein
MRMGFSRLKDRLEDDDPGVVSATVNVITELSRKSNPKNFLPLAPQLFELLTTSSNNWMLIKIVKLVIISRFWTFERHSSSLSGNRYKPAVCNVDSDRASSGTQTAASHHQLDLDHTRYIAAIRMCSHVHYWRYA